MALLFETWTADLFLTFISLLGIFYAKYFFISSKYWSARNFEHLQPRFLIGNALTVNFKTSFGEFMADLYAKHKKKKALGIWVLGGPVLNLFDLDMIKNILVRDFSAFHDRLPNTFSDKDPLKAHLFNLNGQEWRNMRVKLTPTFTSGKMKMMYPTMLRCGDELRDFLQNVGKTGETIEIKDVLARFTTNIIASCAFGIETDSLQHPDNEFRYFGKKVFNPGYWSIIKNMVANFFPEIQKIVTIRQVPADTTEFFVNTVKETMEYRKMNNVKRNDFMQLLIQLKEQGKIEDVDKAEKEHDHLIGEVTDSKFTLMEAAAQAFVFFIAGFETSSTTMTFTLFELARNQDVQKRLKKEIQAAFDKEGGPLSYEAINKIEYLDLVIEETLRKYPVVPVLFRRAAKEYHFPELNASIDEGQVVFIPLLGITRDPDIFPEPEKFDPMRFSPEEKEKRHSFSSIPFGEGPRNCIGNRFGLLQTKVGLVSLLKTYTILPSAETPEKLTYDPKGFILTVEGGMPVKVVKD